MDKGCDVCTCFPMYIEVGEVYWQNRHSEHDLWYSPPGEKVRSLTEAWMNIWRQIKLSKLSKSGVDAVLFYSHVSVRAKCKKAWFVTFFPIQKGLMRLQIIFNPIILNKPTAQKLTVTSARRQSFYKTGSHSLLPPDLRMNASHQQREITIAKPKLPQILPRK
jgi:hypothetical protein